MGRKGINTHLAAEYYVLSSLHRLGIDSTMTLGKKKAMNIVVLTSQGGLFIIDVTGVAEKGDWPIDEKPVEGSSGHFIALVSYEGKISQTEVSPRVWIVPSEELRQFTVAAKDGKSFYFSRKLVDEKGERYENAWQLVGGG